MSNSASYFIVRALSAAAGGRAVCIGIYIDQFLGAAFLPAPLHIVADGDVGHAHVEVHVLLVAVPFAQRLAPLIVFAKRHDDAG